jgi:enamine deaminase RidA (YjgF/YER057c/UK114 family)
MRCFLVFVLSACASAQPTPRIIRRGDDKSTLDQTLPQAKAPPAAVIADVSRLTFQVSPLSNKGLLTPQMRDALKSLKESNHGGTLIKLRAFVAGTGDLRRVQALLSEAYDGKKEPLPALSIVQVGALPLEGAQVVLEGTSEDKKAVNPGGIEFISGSPTQIEGAADVLRVTCFASSIEEGQGVSAKFPHAAVNVVQSLRDSSDGPVFCEAVRRAQGGVTGKLVFTGLQMAFGDQDADLRLAFDRLEKTLEAQGTRSSNVIFSNAYALTSEIATKAAGIEAQFMKPSIAPLFVENLPSVDASLGIEVIAAVRK